jgi:NOL1/NOP2/fmu family ribosome biogenesis protein
MNEPGQREMVLSYLEERFGIDRRHFSDFEFYMASKGRVFLGPKGIPGRLKPVSVGILVARMSGSVKPSTNLLQLFGRHASRSIVSLPKEQALRYLRGEDLKLTDGGATEGYILLKYLDFPLGCGMLKKGIVKNMLPKAKRIEAKFI